jgi:hypothetical protein
MLFLLRERGNDVIEQRCSGADELADVSFHRQSDSASTSRGGTMAGGHTENSQKTSSALGQVGSPVSVAGWFCLVADGPPLISSYDDSSMSTAGKHQSESLFNDTGNLSKNRLDPASSGEHNSGFRVLSSLQTSAQPLGCERLYILRKHRSSCLVVRNHGLQGGS